MLTCADQTAFLSVTQSLTNRAWHGPDPATLRAAEAIAQTCGLPGIVATILAERGIPAQEAMAYLTPSLRDLMPDPYRLKDMEIAAERLHRAIGQQERIAIFADYDVDGGSSAALLLNWLRMLNQSATLYVPDRIEEGYGPNVPAMEELGAAHDLIICVDCGTLSHDPIAAAGCDVLVIDHHLGGETLPPALAIVNPNRQDEVTDLRYLCAAGVVFMLLVAVNRLMRDQGREGPNLMGLLDLVALATVADVAPLHGLNRAFVRQGLKVMSTLERPGLRALAEIANVKTAPNTYTMGFVFGPRINAGGRVGAANLGAQLLATPRISEAAALAERLDRLNQERREIEQAVTEAAKAQVRDENRQDNSLVWAAGEGWHPGVVGIVASRLKDTFGKPAIVVGFDGDNGKGSGRSVGVIDLGAMIARLVHEERITRGGGHKMAVGLSLTRDQLEPAMTRLDEMLTATGADFTPDMGLRITGLVAPGAATPDLIDQINAAGPFGAGSPSPRVALAGVRLVHTRPVGESHLAMTFADEGGGRLEAIGFRVFESDFGAHLQNLSDARLHVAGRLERDEWGGRVKAKLHLDDAAPAK